MEDKSLIKTMEKTNFVEECDICTLSSECHNVLLANGLEHNLLSISEICDKGNRIIFEPNMSSAQSIIANGSGNICTLKFDDLNEQNLRCFSAS